LTDISNSINWRPMLTRTRLLKFSAGGSGSVINGLASGTALRIRHNAPVSQYPVLKNNEMTATFRGPSDSDPIAAIRTLRVAVQPTEGDMLYALERQRTRILQRTAAGMDVNGAAFTPYSAGYAKQKSRYGRGGTVDLRGRNAPNMLQAMVTTSGSTTDGDSDTPADGGSIGFYDDRSAMLAQVHNEGATIRTRQGTGKRKAGRGAGSFAMPKREFFGASDEDMNDMHADIGSRIEIRLRGIAA
jgi:hypothetical protein